MISPREILNKQFSKTAFGGYKADEVDEYLREIADSYAKLIAEQDEHDKQISALMEQIEQYKKQEESLSSALIGAQKLGDNIVKEAKNKSDLLIRDAGIRSDKMVDSAKREKDRELREMERLKKEVADFKAKILELYKAHLEVISAFPGAPSSKPISAPISKVKNFEEPRAVKVNPESPMNTLSDDDNSLDSDEKYDDAVVRSASHKSQGFVPDLSKEYDEEQAVSHDYKENEAYMQDLDDDTSDIEKSFENIEISNRSTKFGELRFGDNYNISRDDEKRKTNKRRRR